jgi:hypothetical protein
MKLVNMVKRFFIWTFSRDVLNAINAGANYADVENIVNELCNGGKTK